MRALGAAIAVLVGVGAAIGIGNATGKAVEGIARQPEASGKITTTLMLGAAFAEATAIYGLLVSIILIFVGVK
ncbi:MAG: ATP synthase F0 subunit C [Clostridium sp.]|nr:ATP synthase F0 subunit C [Clostridium sp.]